MPIPRPPRRPRWNIRIAVTALLALGLALTGSAPALAHESSGSKVGTPSKTDARWAAMMVVHHQNGITITDLALQKSKNKDVLAIAAQSKADQQRQIPGLRAVAQAGGMAPMPPEPPLDRFNDQQMEMVKKLSGAEFDRAWLDLLSSHHMAAIMMTDVAMAGATSPLAKSLQKEIRDGQLAQVSKMNALREKLGS